MTSVAIRVSVLLSAAWSVSAAANDDAKWSENLASGHLAVESGDYAKAREFYATALQSAGSRSDETQQAVSEGALGAVALLTGDYRQAETWLLSAREVLEKLKLQKQPDYAQVLAELGTIRTNEGKWAEAERLMRQSLEIFSRTGPYQTLRASVQSHLGGLYVAQNRFPEALPLLETSIVIQSAAMPSTRIDLMYSLRALGALWFAQTNYEQARKYFEQAWELGRVLPGSHVAVADSATYLAQYYLVRHDIARAQPLLLRAERAYERAGGEDCAPLVAVLTGLARIDVSERRYAMAEQKLQRVLSISLKNLPPDHIAIGFAAVNLAQLYINQKKYEEAQPLLEQGLAIIRAVYPGGHPSLGATLFEMARLRAGLKDSTQADAYFRQSIAVYEKSASVGDPQLVSMLRTYAAFLRNNRRRDEARQLEARAKAIHALQPNS